MRFRNHVLAFLIATLPGLALESQAQTADPRGYPNRPIRLLVPSSPGGSTDLTARIVARELQQGLGQSVVVDNRAGAGGVAGSEMVARAAPDGYNLLFAFASHTTSPFLQPKMPYDTWKDFAPISQIATTALVLAVNASVPANTVEELIALAKSKPGGMTAGNSQPGSAGHLSMEMFMRRTGTAGNIVSVSYKGGGPALVALLSGEVQFTFATPPTLMPHIKSGKIKVIAASGKKRLPYLPNVPTFDEAGVPGVDAAPWQGMLAPANTPRAIINKLYTEVVKMLKQPDTLEQLAATGSEPVGSSPAEFAAKIKRELEEFGKIIKGVGL
jgi:tripartite-type tricarboxylate transporter receptor subunit TctC